MKCLIFTVILLLVFEANANTPEPRNYLIQKQFTYQSVPQSPLSYNLDRRENRTSVYNHGRVPAEPQTMTIPSNIQDTINQQAGAQGNTQHSFTFSEDQDNRTTNLSVKNNHGPSYYNFNENDRRSAANATVHSVNNYTDPYGNTYTKWSSVTTWNKTFNYQNSYNYSLPAGHVPNNNAHPSFIAGQNPLNIPKMPQAPNITPASLSPNFQSFPNNQRNVPRSPNNTPNYARPQGPNQNPTGSFVPPKPPNQFVPTFPPNSQTNPNNRPTVQTTPRYFYTENTAEEFPVEIGNSGGFTSDDNLNADVWTPNKRPQDDVPVISTFIGPPTPASTTFTTTRVPPNQATFSHPSVVRAPQPNQEAQPLSIPDSPQQPNSIQFASRFGEVRPQGSRPQQQPEEVLMILAPNGGMLELPENCIMRSASCCSRDTREGTLKCLEDMGCAEFYQSVRCQSDVAPNQPRPLQQPNQQQPARPLQRQNQQPSRPLQQPNQQHLTKPLQQQHQQPPPSPLKIYVVEPTQQPQIVRVRFRFVEQPNMNQFLKAIGAN